MAPADRVAARYLSAAAPYLVLPGRNRSMEYNPLPGKVAEYLMENPVVYVQDEAGFVDPKKLARDVVEKVSMHIMLDSREAERDGNTVWASALVEVAKDVEQSLDVKVSPVTSPKTGKAGWRIVSKPEVRDMLQEAEQMANSMWDEHEHVDYLGIRREGSLFSWIAEPVTSYTGHVLEHRPPRPERQRRRGPLGGEEPRPRGPHREGEGPRGQRHPR